MFGKRSSTAGRFAIEIGGFSAGWVYSYEGGLGSADVVDEKSGPDNIKHKHIANIKYNDITISCGASMTEPFSDWITSSFSRDYMRKDGALIDADFNLNETGRLNFHEALVTEIGLPACDASSKEAARLNLKLSPEWTEVKRKAGPKVVGYDRAKKNSQKRWLTRNFHIEIDGINCRRTRKVEGITLVQKVTEVPLGEFRSGYREPAQVDYPNVVITIPEVDADGLYAWYEDFIVKGNCRPDNERTGSLDYLCENIIDPVASLNFNGLGLFKLTADKAESGTDNVRSVKAEFYCESIDVEIVANS
jgi:hypothetical protein